MHPVSQTQLGRRGISRCATTTAGRHQQPGVQRLLGRSHCKLSHSTEALFERRCPADLWYTPPTGSPAYGADDVRQDGSGSPRLLSSMSMRAHDVQDVNMYSANHRLPKLTNKNFRQNVPPGCSDSSGRSGGPQGWYGEETLDVEAVHSMAPARNIIYRVSSARDRVTPACTISIDSSPCRHCDQQLQLQRRSAAADFINTENQYISAGRGGRHEHSVLERR